MAFVRSFTRSIARSLPMLNVKLWWRTFAVITFATAILCSTCKYLFIECSQTFMKCMLCFHIIRLLLEICSSFSSIGNMHWGDYCELKSTIHVKNTLKSFGHWMFIVFFIVLFMCVCVSIFPTHFLLVQFHRTTLSAQSNQP